MNIPSWLIMFFTDTFNGAQVEALDQNWWKFSQLSLSNSSREELILEAKTILTQLNMN